MKIHSFLLLTSLVTLSFAIPSHAEDSKARGRYLTIIGGCNDCHTAGYAPSGGTIPEQQWLKGDPIGWHGPWGTSYAINLRNLVAKVSSDEWVKLVKGSTARPPMPSYVFNTMSEKDIRAIYDYIRSLGAAGEEMPTGLAPGEEPTNPYINFTPVFPGLNAPAAKEAARGSEASAHHG